MMFVLLVICGLPLFFVPTFWPARKILAVIAAFITVYCSVSLLILSTNVFSALIIVVGLYRVFNFLRVFEERMHDVYLRRATARTEVVLAVLQLTVILAGFAWSKWQPSAPMLWAVLAA